MRTLYHIEVRGPEGSAWCRHLDRAAGEKLARAAYRRGAKLRRCPRGLAVRVMRYQIEETTVEIKTGFEVQEDLFSRPNVGARV